MSDVYSSDTEETFCCPLSSLPLVSPVTAEAHLGVWVPETKGMRTELGVKVLD